MSLAAANAVTPRALPLRLAAYAAMTLVLLAPALWNGFPFIFPDTGGYLARPLTGTLELGRSALYGAFLAAGVPLDFWPVVVVQAALTAWLVALTLRAYGLGRNPVTALAVAVALTLASAAPWYADTLMPDSLLPVSVLAIHLLAFRSTELNAAERVALIALIAFAIASHMGTLGLCLGLLVVFAIMRFLPHLPRARLGLAAIATAAGLLLAPLSNLAITGQFAFTPGGETFLFGRLVQDGIVARYLADRCPDPTIKLCAFTGKRMPQSADDWLWAPGNPLGELGGWRAYRPEARRIIGDTLRMYLGMHVATAIGSTLKQLAMMKTEVSVNPEYNAPAIESLGELVPQIMPRLNAARQQAAPFSLDWLNIVHVAVAAISVLGLIGIVLLASRFAIAPPVVALAFTVLVALGGNAAICGIFSNPVDRYESRLIWLAPLALFIAACQLRWRTRK
jgi:hypothetical protein